MTTPLMILAEPTPDECELVRHWRNQVLYSLRTPQPLSKGQQKDFYKNVTMKPYPLSPHRYWSIKDGRVFAGFGGLTHISKENRIAEISLIINPKLRKHGYGEKVVELLLNEAFEKIHLRTVCGEVYHCNTDGIYFWGKIADKYNGYRTLLPNRKFWDGMYYDSLYFSIDSGKWERKPNG